MANTMAEFTVRLERNGKEKEAQVQLVIHGDDVVAESPLTPITLKGNNLYLDLYERTLVAIRDAT